MSEIRANAIGRIIYDSLAHCTFFLPILIHNIKTRRRKLLPLYQKLNSNQKESTNEQEKRIAI